VRQLTLLRHAKSSWADSRLSDHDRPLANRGLRDAPRMGRRLEARGIAVDLMLTSTAVRARQTAELVDAALSRSPHAIREEPRIYLASPGELLEVLSAVEDVINALVLVGHNPGLTQLANLMLRDLALPNLPTAGVVAVDCDIDSWSAIASARFSLRFYDYPKNTAA
jgi:phosphohistidine phosphatase